MDICKNFTKEDDLDLKQLRDWIQFELRYADLLEKYLALEKSYQELMSYKNPNETLNESRV